MREQHINRVSGHALVALSLSALGLVLVGYTQPPLPDEGTLAHLFQFSIVAVFPTILIFLATADWTTPARCARRLVVPTIALILAFGALYYLEHYYYPEHYR